jgi:hypothetical protein
MDAAAGPDAWPVAGSGLPARIVNRCAEAGIATVGQLRAATAVRQRAVPGISAGSAAHLLAFLEKCRCAAASLPPTGDLDAILASMLRPVEREVLDRRYGLTREAGDVPLPRATLQALGATRGLTRERIRQIERRALLALGSRLGQAFLAPISSAFARLLASLGGVAVEPEVAAVPVAGIGGHPPAAVLRLLADCGGPVLRHRGFFTALPAGPLREIERRALLSLGAAAAPVPLDSLARDLAPLLPPDARRDDSARRILACILDHLPGICGTEDGAYFRTADASRRVLRQTLAELGGRAHCRDIQREYNRRMRPGSRKGCGFVLARLREDPAFRREGAGIYRLDGAEGSENAGGQRGGHATA